MDERPAWLPVALVVLRVLLVALFMAWLARNRFRARPAAEARTLAHPTSTLVVGVVTLGFWCGVLALGFFAPKGGSWWAFAGLSGFALLSALLIVEYYRARHTLSDGGIDCGRLFQPRVFLRWSELRSAQWDPVLKWFRLEARTGEVAHISAMLMGLPAFARVLLARAPGSVVDEETSRVLYETAAGRPPSIWWL